MINKHICLLILLAYFETVIKCSSEQHLHKTKAAISEKLHDLWCYKCDTTLDGERCLDLEGNHSQMHTKCHKDQRKCEVRRISMSTSTDEITGKPKLWLLQRNCSETCEPGCIVIGERTKLHSCITCCDERNFCNVGSGANRQNFIFKCLFDNNPLQCLNVLPNLFSFMMFI